MKISRSWVGDFLPPGQLGPAMVAEKLSAALAEVEKSQERGGWINKKVVVAKILALRPHPRADHLQIATVSAGGRKRDVVCGAANIKPGQIVPLVLPGGRVQTPEGKVKVISNSSIRGIESAGMLASALELGHGDDHHGIWILPKEWQKYLGKSLISLVPDLHDVIWEIENKALTHRPDCFGQLGIAREIAAAANLDFQLPRWWQSGGKSLGQFRGRELRVRIEEARLCSRYSALVVDNIAVGPAPLWLQQRLINVGLRPVNNVVDVTNYVMMELGQPLHAFDARKIGGQEITVRRAKPEERLLTLDGQERRLHGALIIAGAAGPLAVAGIMGGKESEISQSTTAVVLEAANFDKAAIRRGARRLGLQSEASLRFEKGLDPNLTPIGLARAIELIKQIMPAAKVVSPFIDVYPQPEKQKKIIADPGFINKILGGEISGKTMADIFRRLGLEAQLKKGKFTVVVPTFRRDLQTPEDLSEEVGRIYGYDRLPAKLPLRPISPVFLDSFQKRARRAKMAMAGLGFDEVYSYAFVGQDLYQRCRLPFNRLIPLRNPLSPQLAFLKDSLLPHLLEKAALNRPNFDNFGLFELAHVFHYAKARKTLPFQPHFLAAVLFAADKSAGELFLAMKGKLQALLGRLLVAGVHFEPEKAVGCWQPVKKAAVFSGAVKLGQLGLLHPALADEFNLAAPLAMFELDFDLLAEKSRRQINYRRPLNETLIKKDISRPAASWQELEWQLAKEFGDRLVKIKFLGIYKEKYAARLFLKKKA